MAHKRIHLSYAYYEGRSRAFEAACELERTAVSPSMADKAEFSGEWRDFMAGWHAGMKKYIKQFGPAEL
jgi:hypothetical protein